MKKILMILLAALMLLALAACGNRAPKEASAAPEPAVQAADAEDTAIAETAAAPAESAAEDTVNAEKAAAAPSDVLVVFFSATGTTRSVAEKIAAITGGDLYEIVPAEPYSDADLNWNDRNSRSTKEQNDKSARPGIAGGELSLEGYTTVYLGFPIWWGEEPRILDTFVEKTSFDGIRAIPFCTSASSGIGHSGPNMEALAGNGTWLDGKRFDGSVSEADLQSWIEGLK